MWRKSALSGSRGAMSGAANPTTTISRATRPPTAASQFWRRSVPMDDLLVADPGIEPGEGEVDADVDPHADQGVEQHQVLDHDDVALDDGGDEGASDCRHPEGMLHRHRAAQHEPQQH